MARILVIENLPDGADAEWVQDGLRRMLGDDIEIQQIAIEEVAETMNHSRDWVQKRIDLAEQSA